MTIYRYAIFKDCVRLYGPGHVMTILNQEGIEQIKEWEREAEQFAKTRDEVTSYINYKIDTEW